MSKKIEDLKLLVKEAPLLPGVYLMKNRLGKTIYVGKAKNIRNRVRNYFQNSKDLPTKTRLLVSYIYEIEFLTTNTEAEAFLLEASLIKKYKPKFNIRLKDDKSYPYLRVSLSDDFPRLYLSRSVKGDPEEYFGPFTSSQAVRETIKFLNQTFQIRDCRDHVFKNRKRPCLTYQIGRCTAPCVGYINIKDYKKDIISAIDFLKSKNYKLIKDLEIKMRLAAKDEKFEQAARIRDSLNALNHILERQNVVKSNDDLDRDVISYYKEEEHLIIESLHLRQGIMIGKQNHYFSLANTIEMDDDIRDSLTSFVMQYYADNLIPDEILMPLDIGKDLTILMEKLLLERKSKKVKVRFPLDSEGRDLLKMARNNAIDSFKKHMQKKSEVDKALEDIRIKLKLAKIPERIECYDISHFQGEATVASQVVFENGQANKDQYRKYKIKTVTGIDDFQSMKEVLMRRLKHKEWADPDLIVVDGGKGQLKLAYEALKECGREDIAICSLAKARTKGSFEDKEVESSLERVYLPKRDNPVIFYPNSIAFQILTGIRDEAHRFAISFHRKLRDKKSIVSELDFIKSGDKKNLLLKHFKDIEGVKKASLEDLKDLVGLRLAKKIKAL